MVGNTVAVEIDDIYLSVRERQEIQTVLRYEIEGAEIPHVARHFVVNAKNLPPVCKTFSTCRMPGIILRRTRSWHPD